MRIKNNVGWEMLENGKSKVYKDKRQVEIRVVSFCDLESREEYRLATNLEDRGEFGISNQEISEIYKQRWPIELCWKFLKMHLKLDRNEIQVQD